MPNQTVTIKLHDAKTIISALQVTKTHDQPVTIQAQKGINYELIDDATQFAPENIKIQRVGNDLYIGFEDDGVNALDPDLIIQGYYGTDGTTTNLLIGLHENGSYYAYVPETGAQQHAVSMLADQVSVGQALGGEPLTSAAYEFNPYWLLALIPLVGLAAAGGGGGGGGGTPAPSTDKPDVVALNGGVVTVKPGSNNVKQVITYTDESNNPESLTATKGSDGKWSLEKTPTGVSIDSSTGLVTIGMDAVKDGSTVNSTGTNSSNNTATDSDTAKIDDSTPTSANVPDVMALVTGAVAVKPGADNVKQVVTYIDESNNPVTLTAIKGADGKWSLDKTLANVLIDPATGVIALGPDAVKDGSIVKSVGTDAYNNTATDSDTAKADETDTQGSDLIADKPNVLALVGGSVTVTPGVDNVKEVIRYTDESNNPVILTATKGASGIWSLDSTPTGVIINPVTGVVTIGMEAVKDGSTVTSVGSDQFNNTASDSDTAHLDVTSYTVTFDSITNDTGSSNSDFITNDNSLLFKGTVDLADGNSLSVKVGSTTYLATDSRLTVDGSGNWTLDLTGSTLLDGSYAVIATVTDSAGNSKSTTSQNVVIDTKIDTDNDGKTVTFDSITNDTGSSNSDFITNDNSLLFKGTVDLADGNSLSVKVGSTTYLATDPRLTVDGSGNWTLDLTGSTLLDGSYAVIATVTDSAGNTASSTSQNVVIDTKIDTDNDGKTVTFDSITNDTGSSNSDLITNDNSLLFKGTVDLADGNSLSVKVGSTTYLATDPRLTVDGSGNWTLDLTGSTLLDGSYAVIATVTDSAGNTASSTSQNVVIDTKIDTDNDGKTVTFDSITNDTGSSNSDLITNDNSLLFKGTVDLADGNSLSVKVGSTTYLATDPRLTVDGSGNWTLDLTGSTLLDGSYAVIATVTDSAGNSKSTTSQNVVIDTKIDTDNDGKTVTFDSITNDTGSSNSDLITNDNSLLFKGTVDLADGNSLSVTVGATTYSTADPRLTIDPLTGAWTLDLTGTSLADGSYAVVATVTDAAGNSKSTTSQNVVIDTKIDTDNDGKTVTFDSITNDTGSSNSDFITNDNSLLFKGTVDLADGNSLSVTVGATIYSTADPRLTIDLLTGAWTLDLTGTSLADGSYAVVATVTDAAGNSQSTTSQNVVIDAADAPDVVALPSGAVTSTPGADNVQQVISYTNESDTPVTLTATKAADGTWSLDTTPTGVSIDPSTGVITLGMDAVKDGSVVTSVGTDPYNNSASDNDTALADDLNPNAADAPDVVALPGGTVTSTPGADNVQQVISYTNESDTPVTLTATKAADGTWSLDTTPTGVSIDPSTGVITLGMDAVKDGSVVTSVGTDPYNNSASDNDTALADDLNPNAADAPDVVALPGGTVTSTPGTDNVQQVISYTNESDTPVTLTATKAADGTWSLDTTPTGVSIDPTTGVVSIGRDAVKDGSVVTSVGTDPYNNSASDNDTALADDLNPNAADAPDVVALPGGAVTSTPGTDNVQQVISYTNESDTPVTLTATKAADGTWSLDTTPTGVSIDPTTGVVSIGRDAVKDGSVVTSVGTDPYNNSASDNDTALADDLNPNAADAPDVVALPGGTVTSTPGTDNVQQVISYTNESDTPVTLTATKAADGTWSLDTTPTGVSIDPTTGVVSIGRDAVKDGSVVTSVGTDPYNNSASDNDTALADDLNPNAADAPDVVALPGGTVTSTPGTDNVQQVISYTNESDTPVTLTATKAADGTWSLDTTPTGVSIDPTTGVVSIGRDAVKDGSVVTSVGTDPYNNSASDNDTALADDLNPNAADAPDVVALPGGTVTSTPGTDNVQQVISYTNESDTPVTLTATKAADGTWSLDTTPTGVSIDPSTGVITLGMDAVKDGSVVTSVGTDPYNNSASDNDTALADDLNPNAADAPDVVALPGGTVTSTPGTDNVQQVISYTNESDTPVTLTATKAADGTWSLDTTPTGVSIDPTTGVVSIGRDAVKDGSVVTSVGTDPYNNSASDNDTALADDLNPNAADAPDVVALPGGAVTSTPGTDNVQQVISYTNESDTPVTLTATKAADGTWSLDTTPTGVSIDPTTGVVSIGRDAVKDGSVVTSVGTDPYNNSASDNDTALADDLNPNAADAPDVVALPGGAVTSTPGTDNVQQVISYTNESDTPVTLTATKAADGTWSLDTTPTGVSIDPTTGVVSIGRDAVKDGSVVTSVGTDPYNNSASDNDTALADDLNPNAADAPDVVALDDGSVTVTPGADNVHQDITFTDENNNSQIVTVSQAPDGTWYFDDPAPTGVSLNTSTGVVTIGQDAVKDGSLVTAYGYDITSYLEIDSDTAKGDVVTVSVSEEGLTGANADAVGNPEDTTNSTMVSGTLNLGNLTNVAVTGPSGITSGGQPVSWSGSITAGVYTLTGSAGGKEVAVLTLSTLGAYTFTLKQPIDHSIASLENILGLGFTIASTDAVGTTNSTLVINVEDDSPIAAPSSIHNVDVQPAAIEGDLVVSYGADHGHVQSISVDGYTLTYSSTTDSVSASGTAGSITYSFNATNDELTINKGTGEVLVVDMLTGHYSYSSLAITTAAQAPIVGINKSASLLGLVNAEALDLIGIGTNQLLTAVDPNNDIQSVVVNVGAAISIGVLNYYKLDWSVDMAAEFGIKVVEENDIVNLLLVTTQSYSKLTITSLDGGPIDNLKLNEFLATVYVHQYGIDLVSLGIVPTISISATDSQPVTSSTSYGDLLGVSLLDPSNDPAGVVEGTSATNTLNGTNGDDRLYGYADNDNLTGNQGNDLLRGGAGTDTLSGGSGNDILSGGTGSDTLTGGSGNDTFLWEKGDQGTVVAPAVDTITDFSKQPVAGGGDILDLRGLLVGELAKGTSIGNLANYLYFVFDGTNTILYINTAGTLSAATPATTSDQHITFTNVDLVGSYTTQQEIISNLLKNGNLLVDQETTNTDLNGSSSFDVVIVDNDGDTASTNITFDSTSPSTSTQPNVAPIAQAADATLLGLIGVDALGIIDLNQQAFIAVDANQNLRSVEVEFNGLLTVNLGSLSFSASAQLAAGLGLEIHINNTSGVLGVIGATSTITITAADGGNIDNLAVNELLATIQLNSDINLLSLVAGLDVSALGSFSVTATDSYGATDSDSFSSLLNAQVLQNLLGSGSNPDIIQGTSANDTLNNSASGTIHERLYGFDGDDTLNGSSGNDLLRGGAGNDILNGGDGNDLLIDGNGADTFTGGNGNDVIIISGTGFISIDGGADTDTLTLLGGIDLDLTTSNNITNIEHIDLGNGAEGSKLTLTAADVLEVTGSNTLQIFGDSHDQVQMIGAIKGAESTINGVTMTQYTLGANTVFVDNDIVNGMGVIVL